FDVACAPAHYELYFLGAVGGEPARHFGTGFVDARHRFADAELSPDAFYPRGEKALPFRGYRIPRPVVNYYLTRGFSGEGYPVFPPAEARPGREEERPDLLPGEYVFERGFFPAVRDYRRHAERRRSPRGLYFRLH